MAGHTIEEVTARLLAEGCPREVIEEGIRIVAAKVAREIVHGRLISVTEACQRFGDLARIRGGVTTWIEVQTDEGVWKPVFEGGFVLVGYQLEATDGQP